MRSEGSDLATSVFSRELRPVDTDPCDQRLACESGRWGAPLTCWDHARPDLELRKWRRPEGQSHPPLS